MEKTQKELQKILSDVLGSSYCYYSPPTGLKMKYPCIVYSLSNALDFRADNRLYFSKKRWTVTVMDRNSTSEIPDRVLELPYCTFDRHFVVDNLHHFTFTLFY